MQSVLQIIRRWLSPIEPRAREQAVTPPFGREDASTCWIRPGPPMPLPLSDITWAGSLFGPMIPRQ
jgi:hypothetical protein